MFGDALLGDVLLGHTLLGDALLGDALLGDVLLGHTLFGVENCRLPLKHAKGMSLRYGVMVCLVLEDLDCLKCVSLRLQSKFLLENRSCSNYYS